MDNDRLKRLTALQEKLHYTFRNMDLLSTALTHRSYINENPQLGASDNERLEFLGDAVLGLCVSDLLMKKHTDFDEGTLSKIRSLLVNEKPLADLASKLGLGDCLLLGRGEEHSGGRAKESLLANALEAVIAAIYLDSNFSKTRTLLKRLMAEGYVSFRDIEGTPASGGKTSLAAFSAQDPNAAKSDEQNDLRPKIRLRR